MQCRGGRSQRPGAWDARECEAGTGGRRGKRNASNERRSGEGGQSRDSEKSIPGLALADSVDDDHHHNDDGDDDDDDRPSGDAPTD